jgi:hypothetical protein
MVELDNRLRPCSPRDFTLRNRNCIYCCRPLPKDTRSREHVIGRNFIPRGTLDINLIAWACVQCNNDKSDLEDDISLISMLPPIAHSLPSTDERSADIARKLRSAVSRRTRKLVRDSQENFTIKGQIFPGLEASFNFAGRPQADPVRVHRLALYHISAFHYLMTYGKETRLGEGIPGIFAVGGDYQRADWGNERVRYFMEMTKAWDTRFVLKGKEAFFQAVIRRKMPDLLWSWAVEWNKSFRIFGFYGNEKLVGEGLKELPLLKTRSLLEEPDKFVRMRTEVPLSETDDSLFEYEIAVAA